MNRRRDSLKGEACLNVQKLQTLFKKSDLQRHAIRENGIGANMKCSRSWACPPTQSASQSHWLQLFLNAFQGGLTLLWKWEQASDGNLPDWIYILHVMFKLQSYKWIPTTHTKTITKVEKPKTRPWGEKMRLYASYVNYTFILKKSFKYLKKISMKLQQTQLFLHIFKYGLHLFKYIILYLLKRLLSMGGANPSSLLVWKRHFTVRRERCRPRAAVRVEWFKSNIILFHATYQKKKKKAEPSTQPEK